MKIRTKMKRLITITGVLLNIVFIVLINMNGAGKLPIIRIGEAVIPANGLNGVMQGIVFLLCIIMVCIDYEIASYMAFFILTLSWVMTAQAMFVRKSFDSLPGCIQTFVALISLSIIYRQFRKATRRGITDDLTGLMNKRGFLRVLNKKIADKRGLSVVYMQLLNIREINDNLGHEYGDLVLKKAAERMVEVVGKNGQVFKTDGVEFAILLAKELDAKETTKKIIANINKELTIEKDGMENSYYLDVNAGISRFPEDAEDAKTLVKYADIALMYALKAGQNKCRAFNKEMEDKIHHQREIERLVKSGLENDYFYLVYQPQYVIKGKVLRGFETLIRMKLPDGKVVSPGEFIAIAEQSELIMEIDDYVLTHAMSAFNKVIKQAASPFILSVNVSAKSMATPEFGEKVLAYLEKYQFPATSLEIEITEYSFVESEDSTVKNIEILRNQGVQIALDDFGTGYTSMAQLLKLPINLLKIDKSLIDDIVEIEQNREFVDAIIYMGHLMNCEVISEGVENESQLSLLDDHECDFVQGYVWGRPMAYQDAVDLVKEMIG